MLETALAAIPDLIYIFDLHGKCQYANRALLGLWGRTLEQTVGKDFHELGYPEPLASRLHQQIEQVIETGTLLSGEAAYQSPTGIDGYYDYIFAPVLTAGGAVEAVAGTARDITARKRAQTDLLLRTEQFDVLLNQTPLGVYLIDADLGIRDANPLAHSFFGDLPNLIGLDFSQVAHQLWPAPYAQEMVSRLRHTLDTGETSVISDLLEHCLNPSGTYRYRGLIHPMPSDDGRTGAVCYFRSYPANSPS
jgi:PAS domain S-box-containing protein